MPDFMKDSVTFETPDMVYSILDSLVQTGNSDEFIFLWTRIFGDSQENAISEYTTRREDYLESLPE